MEVQIQHRQETLPLVHFIYLYIRMIGLDAGRLRKTQPIEVRGQSEDAVNDILELEIGLEHLGAEVEEGVFLLLGIVGIVPRLYGVAEA